MRKLHYECTSTKKVSRDNLTSFCLTHFSVKLSLVVYKKLFILMNLRNEESCIVGKWVKSLSCKKSKSVIRGRSMFAIDNDYQNHLGRRRFGIDIDNHYHLGLRGRGFFGKIGHPTRA